MSGKTKYAVVIREIGPHKKELLNEMMSALEIKKSRAKGLLSCVSRFGEQIISAGNTLEEARRLKAALEQTGAAVTVEEQYKVEVWVSIDGTFDHADAYGSELEVLACSADGQTVQGKVSIGDLVDHLPRSLPYNHGTEVELYETSIVLPDGRVQYVDFVVREAGVCFEGVFPDRNAAVYCAGMPYVYVSLTAEDFKKGRYYHASWEDTPEKMLFIPEKHLRLENPFKEVIASDMTVTEDEKDDDTIWEVQVKICPNCGNGATADHDLCPFCNCHL